MKHVLQWHLTHKCNLRCKHCYQQDYCSDLQWDDLKSIFYQYLDFLKAKSYKGHINFTGGEPFLCKHLFNLFDLCQENNITFGILTNGTLLTEETVQKLSKYDNLRFVQISIDGTKKTHDEIRGDGNFDKSFKALKLLRKYNIQTMVAFTCHKGNYHEVRDVIKIVKKNKIDRFWLDRLIPIDDEKDIAKSMVLSTEEYNEVLSVLRQERKKAQRNPFCRTNIHMNRALQFCEDTPVYQCSAGTSLLTILADGTLLPCRRLPIPIGNVLEASLLDLVSNSKLILELERKDIPQECSGCKLKDKCRGGAKCLSYALFGTYNTKDYNCNHGG